MLGGLKHWEGWKRTEIKANNFFINIVSIKNYWTLKSYKNMDNFSPLRIPLNIIALKLLSLPEIFLGNIHSNKFWFNSLNLPNFKSGNPIPNPVLGRNQNEFVKTFFKPKHYHHVQKVVTVICIERSNFIWNSSINCIQNCSSLCVLGVRI